MDLGWREQTNRRSRGSHAIGDQNRGAAFFQPSAHVAGPHFRQQRLERRMPQQIDLSAVRVTKQSQVKPVIVAVAAFGVKHVGHQVRRVAGKNDEIFAADLRGHARHIRRTVVVIVYPRYINIGLPQLHSGYRVDQGQASVVFHLGHQKAKVAFGLGAVMVSKHAEHAQPGMQRGRRAKKGNGRIAVGGVIAAQNDDIRVQAVDRADELVDPALRKPGALMNIGSEDDFQVFQVVRWIFYLLIL